MSTSSPSLSSSSLPESSEDRSRRRLNKSKCQKFPAVIMPVEMEPGTLSTPASREREDWRDDEDGKEGNEEREDEKGEEEVKRR